MAAQFDMAVEESALRLHGILGRGGDMGNSLYAMEYNLLPQEAKRTIELIITGGPFPFPEKDATVFGNRFGDLPRGEYLEFTVPTPGTEYRGARRIVARQNGILFFTACHYERIQGAMSAQERRLRTSQIDPRWQNGFYVITGMSQTQRNKLALAIKRMHNDTT